MKYSRLDEERTARFVAAQKEAWAEAVDRADPTVMAGIMRIQEDPNWPPYDGTDSLEKMLTALVIRWLTNAGWTLIPPEES